MLIPTAVYIVMAVSLNLVVGLLGELSLGHAGFMSVGLFSGCLVAIALTNTALPLMVRLPVSMLAGGLTAAVFGLLVGLPALRLRGDYLAIVTLACGEIIKNIITNLRVHRRGAGSEYLCHLRRGQGAAALRRGAGAADGGGDAEPEALQVRPGHHGHPG